MVVISEYFYEVRIVDFPHAPCLIVIIMVVIITMFIVYISHSEPNVCSCLYLGVPQVFCSLVITSELQYEVEIIDYPYSP